jgi:hypothetical protein
LFDFNRFTGQELFAYAFQVRNKMEMEGEYQEAMKFISPETYSKANKVRFI